MSQGVSRRAVLRGAAGAATTAVVLNAAAPVAAQTGTEPDYGGWFENVDNYDGTIDKTGQKRVTITVGAEGNGGSFAFNPAAVRVDPGTTIVWEWTGKGGVHNVVDEAGAFESEMVGEAGHTFEYSVESNGIIKYACQPHKTMGMKGAIVVGNPAGAGGGGNTPAGEVAEPDYGEWFNNVSNYEKTVDKTGQQEVTITVGAEGNNGSFAFDPPAVRIDSGTTIVWEWSGNGGAHNVAAEDGSFESEMTGDAGFTFEQTFEETGIVKYACVPHKTMGMKAAVVVGGSQADGAASTSSDTGEILAIGGGLGLVGVLMAMFVFGTRSKSRRSTQKSNR